MVCEKNRFISERDPFRHVALVISLLMYKHKQLTPLLHLFYSLFEHVALLSLLSQKQVEIRCQKIQSNQNQGITLCSFDSWNLIQTKQKWSHRFQMHIQLTQKLRDIILMLVEWFTLFQDHETALETWNYYIEMLYWLGFFFFIDLRTCYNGFFFAACLPI